MADREDRKDPIGDGGQRADERDRHPSFQRRIPVTAHDLVHDLGGRSATPAHRARRSIRHGPHRSVIARPRSPGRPPTAAGTVSSPSPGMTTTAGRPPAQRRLHEVEEAVADAEHERRTQHDPLERALANELLAAPLRLQVARASDRRPRRAPTGARSAGRRRARRPRRRARVPPDVDLVEAPAARLARDGDQVDDRIGRPPAPSSRPVPVVTSAARASTASLQSGSRRPSARWRSPRDPPDQVRHEVAAHEPGRSDDRDLHGRTVCDR